MNYQNMGASKLSLDQKQHFVSQMKKVNGINAQAWNDRVNDIGGVLMVPLKEGPGLNDDEIEECWTKAHAMVNGNDTSELYRLHIDLAGYVMFLIPPIKP